MTSPLSNISNPLSGYSEDDIIAENNPQSSPEFVIPNDNLKRKDGLRSIEEIPPKYRHIFQYPYFNKVQSLVLDDVLYSDNSIVVSAPTGSGKTVVFELAIVRLLMQMKKYKYNNDFKIIYMAPMKALCTERLTDWFSKFSKLNIPCIEVTGDSDMLDFNRLKSFRIIMTTPEKWDSLTRRWKDYRQIVEMIKLFIIDEVHLLNENIRGPVLEAVVSRMKTIQENMDMSNNLKQNDYLPLKIRFVAASATIPNAADIATWLSMKNNPAISHKVGEEFRPVQLRKIVEGYPYQEGQSLFKFDLFLSYKIFAILEKYCDGRPTLIFCNTRKSVMLTAEALSKEVSFQYDSGGRENFRRSISMLSDKKLQTLALSGIGCHHAGLLHNDRSIIEQIFRQGDLPILITTSTLAMGVNLPAHLVIIKTTQHYVNGAYTEYDESSVLQMMGRAGRPQFDEFGVAVIMTKIKDKERYERLCEGTRCVESQLHKHLAEHLNAEVALGTLTDLVSAMDWLRSTFLYVRATENPSHYGCSPSAPRESIELKLQEICVKWMESLAKSGILLMDSDTRVVPSEAGVLMANHCLDFDTMKLIVKIKGNVSIEDLLHVLSQCHEYQDILLRAGEKRCLNQLNRNKSKPTIRFTLPGKIQTKHAKVNCLIQAVLGNLPVYDPSLNQESIRIMKIGENIVKCAVAYLTRSLNNDTRIYKSLLNSTLLAKCFAAKMWENSSYVLKQLHGIGPTFAALLVSAGKTTFDSLKQSNPRDLERILGKTPPMGNKLIKQVELLPKYEIYMKQEMCNVLTLVLRIVNYASFERDVPTTGNSHKISLIVGDSENNLLYYNAFSDTHILRMPNAQINRKIYLKLSASHTVFAHCISNNWVGIDVFASINYNKTSNKSITQSPMQYDIREFIKNMSPKVSYTRNENFVWDENILDVIDDEDVIAETPRVIKKNKTNLNNNEWNDHLTTILKQSDNEKLASFMDIDFDDRFEHVSNNENKMNTELCGGINLDERDLMEKDLQVETEENINNNHSNNTNIEPIIEVDKNKKFQQEKINQKQNALILENLEMDFESHKNQNNQLIPLKNFNTNAVKHKSEMLCNIWQNVKSASPITKNGKDENIHRSNYNSSSEKNSNKFHQFQTSTGSQRKNNYVHENPPSTINDIYKKHKLIYNQFCCKKSKTIHIDNTDQFELNLTIIETKEVSISVDDNVLPLCTKDYSDNNSFTDYDMEEDPMLDEIISQEIEKMDITDTDIDEDSVHDLVIDDNNCKTVDIINTVALNETGNNSADEINDLYIKYHNFNYKIQFNNCKITIKNNNIIPKRDMFSDFFNQTRMIKFDSIFLQYLKQHMYVTTVQKPLINENTILESDIYKSAEILKQNKICHDIAEITTEENETMNSEPYIVKKIIYEDIVPNTKFSVEIMMKNSTSDVIIEENFKKPISEETALIQDHIETVNDSENQSNEIVQEIQNVLFQHAENNQPFKISDMEDNSTHLSSNVNQDFSIKLKKPNPHNKKRYSYDTFFTDEMRKYYRDGSIPEKEDLALSESSNINEVLANHESDSDNAIEELNQNVLDPQWVLSNAFKKFQESNKENKKLVYKRKRPSREIDSSISNISQLNTRYNSSVKSFKDLYADQEDDDDISTLRTKSQLLHNDCSIRDDVNFSRDLNKSLMFYESSQSIHFIKNSQNESLSVDVIRQFTKTPKNKIKSSKRTKYGF